MELLSNCCGAKPYSELAEGDKTGLCGACKEGCLFESDDEKDFKDDLSNAFEEAEKESFTLILY